MKRKIFTVISLVLIILMVSILSSCDSNYYDLELGYSNGTMPPTTRYRLKIFSNEYDYINTEDIIDPETGERRITFIFVPAE